ncbi:MAG: hypothetical protein K2X41_14780 [Hyphomicrobium sp.]|nr:hypothetical protein [Hyphomicrobium sp.]
MTHHRSFKPAPNIQQTSQQAGRRPASHGLRPWQWSGCRAGELARLLPLWPSQLEDVSITGRQRIVAVLARALRGERQRGLAGHWAYDLARHAALNRALQTERAALAKAVAETAAPARGGASIKTPED